MPIRTKPESKQYGSVSRCPTVESFLMSHSLHTARGCLWHVPVSLISFVVLHIVCNACTDKDLYGDSCDNCPDECVTRAATFGESSDAHRSSGSHQSHAAHGSMLLLHISWLIVHPLCDPCRCTSDSMIGAAVCGSCTFLTGCLCIM